MTTLRAGDLTPDDLRQLLAELTPPAGEKVRCWLDTPDGWALDYWPGMNGRVRWNSAGRDSCDRLVSELISGVTLGRVFAPSGELKWRLLPALGECCCRVVFLGEGWTGAALEALPARTELAGLTKGTTAYLLWGQQTKHTPGEWVELSIPHRLRYPVEAETPEQGRVVVKVSVEMWKDGSGEPQLIRLCELIASVEE